MSGVFQSIQDLKIVFGFKKLLHKLPTFRDATTSDVWETSTEIPYWWRVIPLSSAEAPSGYPYKNSASNNRKKKKRQKAHNTKRPLQRREVQYPDLCTVVLLIDRRCREENLLQTHYPANSFPAFSPTSPAKERQVGERTWERGWLSRSRVVTRHQYGISAVVPQTSLGSLSKDIFERRKSTGSVVFFLSLYLYETKFLLLSVFTHKEKICHRTRAKPLPENAESLLPVDVRRPKTSLLQLPISWGNQL